MSLLVDSSVWIDFFNGTNTPQTDHLNEILGWERIIVGDLILAEVLQGFRLDREFQQAQEALFKFPILSMVGQDIALDSARNYRILRTRGLTVRKTIDCLIATFCLQNNFELLHNDRDFDGFERFLGLRVRTP